MTILSLVPAALVILSALADPASATGGIFCQVEDKSVKLSLTATTSPSAGDSVGSMSGKLELRFPPVTGKSADLAIDHLRQHWNRGKEIKLFLQIPVDATEVELVIEARDKPARSFRYSGRYEVVARSADQTGKRSGGIVCDAE